MHHKMRMLAARASNLLEAMACSSGQAFLALAFGVEGFLMGSHRKHEALDQSVHVHLAGTMLACAAFAAAEVAAPRSLLLSSARVLASLMQGMWLIAVRNVWKHRLQKPLLGNILAAVGSCRALHVQAVCN